MIKHLIIGCALILLISVSGFAQTDITGKWKGTAQGQQGDMELVFSFQADSQTLTGTVEGPMGPSEIKNGKINGNTFSFDISFDDFTIGHNCEVISEDEILMKTEMFEMTLTWVKE